MTLHHAERLAKVHPDLVKIVVAVGLKTEIIVVWGARSVAQEQADINAGTSHLTDPLDSKHVIWEGRPLAEAVDIAPYPIDWEDKDGFRALAVQVKFQAQELDIPIVWGGDWGWDFSHFQLSEVSHASAPRPT